jgi:hypothetical protein
MKTFIGPIRQKPCKLFDGLIRPVLQYNCEVWYMDDYLPLYRAILRAEKNNKTCDKLSFDYKTSCEKNHTKYCKIILGLKKPQVILPQTQS